MPFPCSDMGPDANRGLIITHIDLIMAGRLAPPKEREWLCGGFAIQFDISTSHSHGVKLLLLRRPNDFNMDEFQDFGEPDCQSK
jgi:hypothetical protein